MNYDRYGRPRLSEQDLVELLYKEPDLDLTNVEIVDPERFNCSIQELQIDLNPIKRYQDLDLSLEQFDTANQKIWFMPQKYQNLDIAAWVLEHCDNEPELQRAGEELLLFQERNLFDLLKYLKYLVDTMREHDIVWGVGRGSSVASFVLYKIGVHKINSLYYDLPITEFLKE